MVGCSSCWPAVAARVPQGTAIFVEIILREAHFCASLRRCSSCAQLYARVAVDASVTSPRGDLEGWHAIPLSAEEAEQARAVARAGEDAVEAYLRGLSPRTFSTFDGIVDGAIFILPHD